jgi:hypothetical protein
MRSMLNTNPPPPPSLEQIKEGSEKEIEGKREGRKEIKGKKGRERKEKRQGYADIDRAPTAAEMKRVTFQLRLLGGTRSKMID